jgi:hypothetical protein
VPCGTLAIELLLTVAVAAALAEGVVGEEGAGGGGVLSSARAGWKARALAKSTIADEKANNLNRFQSCMLYLLKDNDKDMSESEQLELIKITLPDINYLNYLIISQRVENARSLCIIKSKSRMLL